MGRAFLVCALHAFAGTVASAGESMTLWCRQPAQAWQAALPLGNGRLGAMVFGSTPTERVQLNEESLWAGEPFDVPTPVQNSGANCQPDQKPRTDGDYGEERQSRRNDRGSYARDQGYYRILNRVDEPESTTNEFAALDVAVGRGCTRYAQPKQSVDAKHLIPPHVSRRDVRQQSFSHSP